MDFAQTFEGPVVEAIGGEDVTFPPLLIDDYLPWIGELTARQRQRAEKMIPARATVREEQEMRLAAQSIEVGLETISALIWTVPGSRKVLGLSLAKSGIPADRQAEIQKNVPPRRLHTLAADVSNLFERRKPAAAVAAPKAQPEGDPDPNSSSPEGSPSLPAGDSAIG